MILSGDEQIGDDIVLLVKEGSFQTTIVLLF